MRRGSLLAMLLLTQVVFGGLTVAGKIAFGSVTPPAVAYLRIALGATAFVLIAHAVMRVPLPRARDLPILALLGLLGVILNQFLFLEGLERTTVVGATLMTATIPVWAGALALGLGHERANASRLAGIALGFAGIALLVFARGGGLGSPFGNFLIALNAVSYALFLVVGKGVVRRLGPVLVTTWTFVISAVLSAPFGAGEAIAVDWAGLGWQVWVALAYIVLLATVFAHGANVIALKHTQSSTVAGLIYLQPVVATILGVTMLGERPGVEALLAGALVLAGVALVMRSARVESRPRAGTDA